MEISFTPNDRGQVGIGTLIVFIAMVLVAAIAAGVLINTAGFLQTQAEDTGTESTEQVANNLNVITEVGIVEDTGSGAGEIKQVEVGLQPAAGSDDLNLEELSIQYVSDEDFSNLVHTKAVSTGDDNSIVGEDTVFNTVPVTAEDGQDNVMTDNADRYDLVVPFEEDEPFATSEAEDDDIDELATRDLGAESGELEDGEIVVVESLDDEGQDNNALRVVLYEELDPEQLELTEEEFTVNSDDHGGSSDEDVLVIEETFLDEVGNDNLQNLNEGEEAEVTFTTETGAQTVTILQVPDSLAGEDDDDAVDL